MKQTLHLLCIGDVIGQPGCDFLHEVLPNLKHEQEIDLVIANGENSAVGNGILPGSATSLLDSGVDVVTTGNHVLRRREIYDYLDQTPQVIRPANLSEAAPGAGFYQYDLGAYRICVINLMGVAFMDPVENPFLCVEHLLDTVAADCYVVDFHAEATGEKKALAYHLDGRISLLYGTHTHTQTADEQILPQGTGFITDLGMTGPIDSVLGVKKEQVISKMRTRMPVRFEVPTTACQLEGILVQIDKMTNRCTSIRRIQLR